MLGCAGCDLFAGRVDALGHAELRQRPAAASDGDGAWSVALAVSQDQGRKRLQRKLVHHRDTETQRKSKLMLTRERAADIFDRIKKFSSADEVEVLFSGGKFALTRFANNTIHQNVAEENYGVSVRTAFGGRTARASTNKLDDESLRRVLGASEELAKVQHPDPDLLPMPDVREAAGGLDQNLTGEAPVPTRALQSPQTLPSRHFSETVGITPELRAEGVKKIVGVALKHELTAAGIFSSGESVEGIFNSRGLAHWHTQTSADISITMLGANSSGWQKGNSPNVANLDPLALGATAA